MSLASLQQENEALRAQVLERDEQLATRDEQLLERDKQLLERDARVDELQRQVEELVAKLKLTAREHRLLAEKLARLHALRKRVPLLAPGQGVLQFDELVPEPEAEQPPHVNEAPDGETPDDKIRKRHRHKQRARKLDLSNLPVEHAYHELPEEERICSTTGKALVPVGEKLEDEVEYQPGRLKRIVHHHTVYGLSAEDAEDFSVKPITAPGPPRPIEGSIVGPMLLAWILVQKYAHHLPLYRQQSILGREGLAISRKTSCDWVMAAATALQPIQEALRREILGTGVVQLDDTPVRCQGPKGHGNFQAHLWSVTSPVAEGVLYEFTEGRSTNDVLEVLGSYEEGWVVGDGCSSHVAATAERPGLILAGCWAHAIRKFKDAMAEAPVLAVEIVTTIAKLFELEEELRECTPDERLARRRESAPPLIETLDGLVDGWRDRYSESGKLAEACKYLENQRVPLLGFLEDGRVPIHNNACEVAIRPIAVGRKNWLFAGSVRGGHAAATFYTLVQSCTIAGVDPLEYLADVLIRVATHPASRVDELIPARWKQLAR